MKDEQLLARIKDNMSDVLETAYECDYSPTTMAKQSRHEAWCAYRWGKIQALSELLNDLGLMEDEDDDYGYEGPLSEIAREKYDWDERSREVIDFMRALVE